MNFVDETLVIPFATRVEALAGSAEALTSSADRRAELRLDGRIPPTGSAHIEAKGSPTAPYADTEVELNFKGVPMPSMTPWTATFAGYRVAGGRLSLDLLYQIDNGNLEASNDIVIHAMRLGEPIESPRAMDIPLRLALALLRDSDDNISLGIPVSGRVDDPSFNLQPAILGAIGNILTNLVSAPFWFLASLVGGSEEKLGRVVYAPGSATLADDQASQLLLLERALGERPELQLVLPAVHAGDADRAALRVRRLAEQVAAVNLPSEQALRELFAERVGAAKLEALETAHAEASDATQEGTDRGLLLAELEQRLLGSIEIPDAELDDLARHRAEAIYVSLTETGLDRTRLRIAADASEVKLAGEQVPLSFELDALDP